MPKYLKIVQCCRVLTIHNSPEEVKFPAEVEHLRMQLADVETQDISPLFAPSYDFIEAGVHAKEGVTHAP